MPLRPTEPIEVDTRTYLAQPPEFPEGFCSRCGLDCSCSVVIDGELVPAPHTPHAVTSEVVVIGHGGEEHGGFPCPPTRGQMDCGTAWETWRRYAPLRLHPLR